MPTIRNSVSTSESVRITTKPSRSAELSTADTSVLFAMPCVFLSSASSYDSRPSITTMTRASWPSRCFCSLYRPSLIDAARSASVFRSSTMSPTTTSPTCRVSTETSIFRDWNAAIRSRSRVSTRMQLLDVM